MRADSDFPHRNRLRVSFFQQKIYHFQILPVSIKIYYLKLMLPFVIFLDFPICTKNVEDLFHEQKILLLSVCFPLEKT